MMIYFGERWNAPIVAAATPGETPIGTPCIYCEEAVREGDRGFIRGTQVSHRECEVYGIFGHDYGVCGCTGYQPNRTSALKLWDIMSRPGPRPALS